MRTVEEQVQAALASATALAPLDLSLRESRGCVVASDVTATYPIPSFDAAAFDGFAVRAESIVGASTSAPVNLQVIDAVGPGYSSDFQVGAGQAVRVLAGTLIPNGAETVVPVSSTLAAPATDSVTAEAVEIEGPHADSVGESEPTAHDGDDTDTESSAPAVSVTADEMPKLSRKERRLLKRQQVAETAATARVQAEVDRHAAAGGEWVAVTAAQVAGVGVALAGSQRAEGAHLLAAGTRLGDRELAAVASGGHARISVHPEPRVVIITVGDGLVDTSRALTPGLAYDVVSVMLVAAAEQAGATTFRGGPSRRDALVLARTIQDQLVRADLIVIAGEDESVSDPQSGLVASALRAAGCQDLEYCELQPGPVVGLGTVGEDGISVITVGSSALAAFVGFEVLVRPTIAALAGRQSLFRPVVRATLTESVTGTDGVREFRPGTVRLDAQGTRALVSAMHEPDDQAALWLANANALAILPEDAAAKDEGDEVAVIRLDRE